MGTIVLSLPPSSPLSSGIPSIAIATATQVRLFSLANTFGRLLVGPLADFMSPVTADDAVTKQIQVRRVAFFSAATISLCFAYIWMVFVIRTQEGLWVLR
jgi:hypothetical protein